LSKFDRYKKKGESYYVYPHKHCQKCGQMIDESVTYCSDCYKELKEKKNKKKKKEIKETNESENKNEV